MTGKATRILLICRPTAPKSHFSGPQGGKDFLRNSAPDRAAGRQHPLLDIVATFPQKAQGSSILLLLEAHLVKDDDC